MKLGLNLSFAVKRWYEPEELVPMISNDFKTKYIQFTWDLVNPWWPVQERDKLAKKWSKMFKKENIILDGTFAGIAAYTYPQLLASTDDERKIAVDFFKRAIDMTSVMETNTIGSPLGGMTHKDAYDKSRRREIYKIAIEHIRELSAYAKIKGLKKILIEPTPLFTEFPSTPEESLQLMKDLDGTTDIPVRLLIDWGHALFEPLLKEKANMTLWINTCKKYIDGFHLQQTDGKLDRHWDFTREGKLTPKLIKELIERTNVENVVQYVELIFPFEESDEIVYENVKRTMEILTNCLVKANR